MKTSVTSYFNIFVFQSDKIYTFVEFKIALKSFDETLSPCSMAEAAVSAATGGAAKYLTKSGLKQSMN